MVDVKATVEVDKIFENCQDYTEKLGYKCVPYYQCNNGNIITDGVGMNQISNGFGALTPEHSKCPGYLEVCCKDFIRPVSQFGNGDISTNEKKGSFQFFVIIKK